MTFRHITMFCRSLCCGDDNFLAEQYPRSMVFKALNGFSDSALQIVLQVHILLVKWDDYESKGY